MVPISASLIEDIRLLAAAAQEDFDKAFWPNYQTYLDQFNTLLSQVRAAGLCADIQPIDPVPERRRAGHGIGFSSEEHAKLREISNSAQLLLRRLTPYTNQPSAGPMVRVEQICSRFHLVARQLRARHNNRGTLQVKDEYDVQDLLHSLLVVDFDDIRAEEWTPSYAGKSARMDFLLKNEKLVIEVKKTRPGLNAKELGDQLIIDIRRYQAHPECQLLVCFVYDPEGRIANHRGIETDLNSHSNDDLKVITFIRPTGL